VSDADVEGLQRCLAAEHAAIYAYGVLGGRLAGLAPAAAGPKQELAQTSYAAHRARRDALVEAIEGLDADPVAADPAYALPFTPSSAGSCARLARYIEARCCEVYAYAVSLTSDDLRRFAAHALIDAASRGVAWGAPPQAFPGRPDL
jgi:hypothetical protein